MCESLLLLQLCLCYTNTWQDSSLTDGLEALERVGNADKVLSVWHTSAGVIILSFLSYRGEVRGAVYQPEALIFIQQHDT